jgi:hypothetical protein
MYFLRTTKTASGATAVQIIRYEARRKIVVKHIGSAHISEEIASLKQQGLDWIERTTCQQRLFPFEKKQQQVLLPINKCQYLGFRYTFLYEVISSVFHLFGFQDLRNRLLLDLVLMRIVQPVSKLESLELLSEMFGIRYGKSSLYSNLASLLTIKEAAEGKVVAFAKRYLNFTFSIVFYDVTTLYFESFTEDELRENGFSKDNKRNQPQILIGLIVNGEGFPVSYEIFEGNTFEGHTLIPSICRFREKYGVQNLTVVADAAMISTKNIEALVKNELSYIVGARIGNLPRTTIKKIAEKLHQTDGATIRIETAQGILICDFSAKRYKKNLWEMEKQIDKAKKLLEEKEAVRRTKFIRNIGKTRQKLNADLIEKTKLILGIRGYYTNLLQESDETIITHYHNLWHVEQAFRISKSDLATRPIYHFKKQTIEAHILICYLALAVSKYLEIKTGKSIKKIVKLLKSITEARILNKLTGEIIVLRKELTHDVEELWKTLLLRY